MLPKLSLSGQDVGGQETGEAADVFRTRASVREATEIGVNSRFTHRSHRSHLPLSPESSGQSEGHTETHRFIPAEAAQPLDFGANP